MMKYFTILLVLAFLQSGCTRKEPVELAFNDIQQSVQTLEQTLPAECKTDQTMIAINKLQAEITEARATCQTKILDYQTKYERAISVIFFIILAFFVKFLLKK